MSNCAFISKYHEKLSQSFGSIGNVHRVLIVFAKHDFRDQRFRSLTCIPSNCLTLLG